MAGESPFNSEGQGFVSCDYFSDEQVKAGGDKPSAAMFLAAQADGLPVQGAMLRLLELESRNAAASPG